MAKVLRGRHNGETIGLHQASNDWVSVDLETPVGLKPLVLNPTSIGFETDADREVVENAGGHFWALFEWTSDARVRLQRRQAVRS